MGHVAALGVEFGGTLDSILKDSQEFQCASDCDSIDGFAEDVQDLVVRDHPVMNRTGLSREEYEIKLDASPDEVPCDGDAAEGPSLFSALPAQPGLT